jgi:hypothetical protein
MASESKGLLRWTGLSMVPSSGLVMTRRAVGDSSVRSLTSMKPAGSAVCIFVGTQTFSNGLGRCRQRFNGGSNASRVGGRCWSTAFIMKPTLK